YVYITIYESFRDDLLVKYSRLERVLSARELEHPLFREALGLLGIEGRSLEIVSMADIPAGTGLGSSGSFTTALLKALHTWRKNIVRPAEIAAQACEIEINRLHEPVGKQDQYIAAVGGVTSFHFLPGGSVEVLPVELDEETLFNLQDNLLLFFTGYTRSASMILKEQNDKTKGLDKTMVENLHFIKELGV